MNRYYGITLVDDLHTYFPAILYEPERFTSIQHVLQYVQDQVRYHSDFFSRNQGEYRRSVRTPSPTRRQSMPYENPTITTQTQEHPERQVPLMPRSLPRPPRQQPRQPIQRPLQSLPSRHSLQAQQQSESLEEPIHQPPSEVITETFDITPLLFPVNNSSARYSQNDLVNMSNTILLTELFNILPTLGINTRNQEPVLVRPSVQQIESSSSLRQASSADESQTCSICQDSYTEGQAIRSINHCNHNFHKTCIDPWFQQNVRCPVCRYDIRETQTTANI